MASSGSIGSFAGKSKSKGGKGGGKGEKGGSKGEKGNHKGYKGPPTDDEAEESDGDDAKYKVRHLRQDEDLVIDGETVVDDMLVAQRIAEQDSMIGRQVFEDDPEAPIRKK
ncbi:unnamed protein product, partial [Polarella glacialis]